ncbi:MAG: aldehyde dehydrogenase EutE [Armatimonadetes bacterium]|nr:aldehyde dehydrogenase EutE [Armatimonadota bacterium]
MSVDKAEIRKIVEEVVRRYGERAAVQDDVQPTRGVFDTIDECTEAARRSQQKLMSLSLDKRKEIVAAMRKAGLDNARLLAEMASAETGLGRPEDKVKKNILVSTKTPGPEDLEPVVFTGDHGLTLVELAPFGVIGSVTPSTNPGATIINNSISMVSAGNGIVFNPHPSAKKVCLKAIELINTAIESVGGPPHLLTSVREPTLETSQALMTHRGIRVLVVTGGMGVVKQAMKSGKRAICAGPGNPPVVVDETADLELAGREIVNGSSFDNNVMCTCEKEAFVVDRVFNDLKEKMKAHKAHELSARQLEQVMAVIFTRPGFGETRAVVNKDLVGKNAAVIARTAGFDVPADTRLLITEVTADHALVQTEQLMPVFPLVRVKNVNEGIEAAIQAEHGYNHTAVMYSRNLDALSHMASAIECSLFVKNGPNYASLGMGGEGFTTMTIAGSTGEGVTSARVFTRPRRCSLVDYFRII